MKVIDKEHKELLREEWLSLREITEEDVFEEPNGREYILVDIDEEVYKYEKEYLPDELQSLTCSYF